MIENYHDCLLAGIGDYRPVYVNLATVIEQARRKQEIKKARRINKHRKVGDPFHIPKF
jgi:hypothetical protein